MKMPQPTPKVEVKPAEPVDKAPSYDHLLPKTFKAVTSVNIPGKGWMLVQLTICDDQVVDMKVSEPDMKMIIMEKQKIAQVKLWKECSG